MPHDLMRNRNAPASEPKFSVIIPTRNGLRYLRHAVDSVLGQPSDAFELIISDNYSSDGSAEYVANLRDPRVRAIRPARPLCMVDHFVWVLGQAKGEWITVIGDDDGLLPNFFEIAERVLSQYSDQYEVFFGPRAMYFWQGLEELYGSSVVQYSVSAKVEELEPIRELERLLYQGDCYFDSAQFYTGTIFSRALLERIKKRHHSGRVFSSITPDANSVAVILLNAKGILRIGVPLAWIGSSPKSNGAQAAKNIRTGEAGSSFQDFNKLNAAAGIEVAARFRAIYAMGDAPNVCFLEALYGTSVANQYGWHEKFEPFHSRHRIFLSLYGQYLARRRKGHSVDAYEQLFRDNSLSMTYLSLLHFAHSALSRPGRIKKKILKRFARRGAPANAAAFSYSCSEPGAHPTINSVNDFLSAEPNRSQIQAVLAKMLGDGNHPNVRPPHFGHRPGVAMR